MTGLFKCFGYTTYDVYTFLENIYSKCKRFIYYYNRMISKMENKQHEKLIKKISKLAEKYKDYRFIVFKKDTKAVDLFR